MNPDLCAMLHIPGLFIAESRDRGRGVFTAQEVTAGDIIEICPVLLIPHKQVEVIHGTVLHDYYFIWPDGEGSAAILLGYGSLYNHSFTPNAKVFFDVEQRSVEIRCLKGIAPGEEILINYREGEDEPDPLWFESI